MATSGVDAPPLAPGRRVGAAALAVAGLTLVAFVLRLPHLGESLFGDEMYAFAEVDGRSLTGVVERVREGGENSPPLFFLLAWFGVQLGDATVWIRLPSLLLGTATVPLVYLVGLRTVGRPAAVVAAALLALSPFAIFYSSEARPYATLMFFVVLSTLALLLALDDGRRRWWAVFAVAGCAALYAHYFAVFALLAQGSWAVFTHRDRARELVIANAAIVIGYVPWLIAFLDQQGNSIKVLAFFNPLGVREVGRELVRLFPGHPGFPIAELPGHALGIAIGLAVLAAAVGAALRRDRPRPGAGVVLVVLLAVAPILGFLVYSLAGADLFISRYVSTALPGIVLVVAAVLVAAPRPLDLAATAVVLAGLTYGALASLEDDHRRPAYKDAAHFIDRVARPDDAVVQADMTLGATRSQVLRGGRQQSLDVNFERDHDVFSVFEPAELPLAFARVAARDRFLLVGPEPLPQPPARLGARLGESREFAGSLPVAVRLYVPADPAAGFGRIDVDRIQRAARRLRLRAAEATACLTEAGLRPRRGETSPSGSIAIEAPLGGGGRAILYVYPSPADASRELPGIASFLEAAGGTAKQIDETVVGYTANPSGTAARSVEGCA